MRRDLPKDHAAFQIALKGCPGLEVPARHSGHLVDFVATCTEIAPRKRCDAEALRCPALHTVCRAVGRRARLCVAPSLLITSFAQRVRDNLSSFHRWLIALHLPLKLCAGPTHFSRTPRRVSTFRGALLLLREGGGDGEQSVNTWSPLFICECTKLPNVTPNDKSLNAHMLFEMS